MAVIPGGFLYGDLIVNHAELRSRSVLTNGLEAMRKYNPATGSIVPLVLRPFRQDVVLAAGGAGNLDGDYIYRIVPYNINEDEEGEAFPLSEENAAFQITVANQSVNINLAGLRIDSPEITHVRIYRTLDGGEWPVLALVGEVIAPFGVFNDNVADADLDFANEALDTLIEVPMPKPYLCQHGEQIFMVGDIPYSVGQALVTNGSPIVVPAAGAVFGFYLEGKEFHSENDVQTYIIDEYDPVTGNLILEVDYEGATATRDFHICGDPDAVIWCEPNYEYQWPAINTRAIGGKEADKATGVMSDAGRLIVGKSRKVYQMTWSGGRPHYPWSHVSLITNRFGCIAHRGMRHVGDIPTFPSKNGIAQVVGGSARIVSRDAADWWVGALDLTGDGIQRMCFSLVNEAKGQLIQFVKSAEAALGADKALVWHYQTQRFTTFEFLTEFSCGAIVKDADGKDILVLGDIHGFVWEFDWGDIDGAPVNSTLSGTVDMYHTGLGSPGYCGFTDLDALFPTSGLGLAGVPFYIHAGTGAGQSGIILGNTEDTVYFECLAVALDATSQYYIGPIQMLYRTGWTDFGTLRQVKHAINAHMVFERHPDSDLRFKVYKDFSLDAPNLVDERTGTDHGLVSMAAETRRRDIRLGGIDGTHLAWEISDDKPNNPVSVIDLVLELAVKE
jgi:hypothetical protein